jgi:GntR family transcriptional regulator, rspAB operon transcriptional repressor
MQVTERFPQETAREYAYRTIKYNIISLDLEPGSMVSESKLSAELGVSRTPVHEALIELSKPGLVEVYPQKGSVISLIDSELVNEVRFLRLVLEKAMVELVCEIASEEDIFVMKENLKLQEFYSEHPSPTKMLSLDNEFHRLLFVICKKENSYRMLEDMTAHFDRVRRLSLTVTGDKNNVADHKKILEAIEKGDTESAKEIITKHLTRYTIDEKLLRKEYPHYFK